MQKRDTVTPVEDLANIYWNAVRAVDPTELIPSKVKKDGRNLIIQGQGVTITEDLSRYKQVVVLGIGKASARMAAAMESILGDDLAKGLVITKYGHGLVLHKIQIMEAGHPMPDENSMEGARRLTQVAKGVDKHTLVINLISGGGSALFCLPVDGVSLEDKRETTRILLASGATINEMNCIRKHISKVKGGGLAEIARPARLINLILSDVMGNHIDAIASGICSPDSTTFSDALSILRKYGIENELPQSVRRLIRLGADGDIPETPKAGHPAFGNMVNIILGDNKLACDAAYQSAKALGYDARIHNMSLEGEASQAGADFALIAKGLDEEHLSRKKPAALIAGGETTVTIRGKGKGGRCQEMALAFLIELYRIAPESRNIFFLSAGTDGSDGPTDAAGAFVTPELMTSMKDVSTRASEQLKDNDAFHFFRETGHLFITGPTFTNVCDIQILMVT